MINNQAWKILTASFRFANVPLPDFSANKSKASPDSIHLNKIKRNYLITIEI